MELFVTTKYFKDEYFYALWFIYIVGHLNNIHVNCGRHEAIPNTMPLDR